MPRRSRRLAAVALLLLGMLVGMASGTGEWTGWFRGQSETAAATQEQTLGTSGGSSLSVVQLTPSQDLGLVPGEPKLVRIRVTNGPGLSEVALLGVEVTWGDAGGTCGRENLHVTPYTAGTGRPLTLGPGGSRDLDLRIELLETRRNQDGCRRASFPLSFTAHGRTLV